MRYMLDTNICIYAIKNKPEQVFIRLREHNPQELCISSVTYAELVHGVEKSKAIEKNRVALALLLANIDNCFTKQSKKIYRIVILAVVGYFWYQAFVLRGYNATVPYYFFWN